MEIVSIKNTVQFNHEQQYGCPRRAIEQAKKNERHCRVSYSSVCTTYLVKKSLEENYPALDFRAIDIYPEDLDDNARNEIAFDTNPVTTTGNQALNPTTTGTLSSTRIAPVGETLRVQDVSERVGDNAPTGDTILGGVQNTLREWAERRRRLANRNLNERTTMYTIPVTSATTRLIDVTEQLGGPTITDNTPPQTQGM